MPDLPPLNENGFGPNQWLVDELYEQYLQDKNSVDEAWWDYFAGYRPADARGAARGGSTATAGAVGSATATAPRPADRPSTAASSAQKAPSAPATRREPAPAPPLGAGSATAPDASPSVTLPAQAQAPAPHAAPTRGASPAVTGQVSDAAKAPAEGSASTSPSGATRTLTPRETPPVTQPVADAKETVTPLRGPSARIVANMDMSLSVPTATSVRQVPAKVMMDNRIQINEHLRRTRGGKVSFTHIIGFAVVRALTELPDMNNSFATDDAGKPQLVRPAHVNLGIAIDLPRPDGTRTLVVPSIKAAQKMDFYHFWNTYEDVVRKARSGKLTVDDFAGTTISLTNPGGIGTVQSVPRLMKGQGCIVGVGAMEHPAEWQGASLESVARASIGKLVTLTSTYDHRIIQGATSGEFLRTIHELLLGAREFYEEIFTSLRIPYEPIRWQRDLDATHEGDLSKAARVQKLIHAYRVRGHLLADMDPLEYRMRGHEDVDLATYGLTLWDLDREVATGGFGGKDRATLREILDILRDSYCRTIGVEYMHIQDPDQREWMQRKLEVSAAKFPRDEQLRIMRRLNAAEAFETFLQTKFVGQKRFSLEGGESVIAILDRILVCSADEGLDEVCMGMPHRGRLNVLANIAGKSYAQIFREFEGTPDPRTVQGSGDVKYHLGTEGIFTSEEGKTTRVYLAANPSHLEAVNPVLEGIVRAKQDRLD
ncbi:MAG: multifunctional oxoglutarate decarboxylase/oxoglutarate dehydrogenase thiamine pyrophosphate-binding subunit/dihydrolipoyllysine-residue succinyltransferase subunit, partial [Dermatophilaceae bacterium]